jgi:hypothetical protein
MDTGSLPWLTTCAHGAVTYREHVHKPNYPCMRENMDTVHAPTEAQTEAETHNTQTLTLPEPM